MIRRFQKNLRWLLALSVAGCEVGPTYHPPHFDSPAQFSDRLPGQTEPLGAWWRGFRDPELDRLIQATIDGNLTVQMMRNRIIEARSERNVAAAAMYPQIGAAASPGLAYSPEHVQWPPGTGAYRTYELGFDASWELDIFGGIHRAEEAGQAEVEASIEQRHGALVSAVAEVATDYIALRGVQARILVAEQSLTTAKRLAALTQQEFERGISTSLAVAQAQAQVDTVSASLPELHEKAGHLAHAIAVLTGKLPGALEAELLPTPARTDDAPGALLPKPPTLPESIPSEVIANRPDIRMAERHLAAATARIGAAVSELYPHFTVPLMLMPTSSYLSNLFTSESLLWSVAISATQSIYQGGRVSARIEAAKAAAENDKLAYRQTVLHAFQEVEDALLSYAAQTERAESLNRAVQDNQAALDRSERLFRAGLTDFLSPLSAERSLYAAEDAEIQSRVMRLTQLITLDKAIGGGWQAIPLPDDAKLACDHTGFFRASCPKP